MHDSALTINFLDFSNFLCPTNRNREDAIHKNEDSFFFILRIFLLKMFYGCHVKPCHNLHEVFELPQGLLTHDYMVHASVIRVDVGIDVLLLRLSYGTKQMLHRVRGQAL